MGLHERYARWLGDVPRNLDCEKADDDARRRLSSLFGGMMRSLFKEKGAEFRVELVADPAVQEFVGAHASVMDSAFKTVGMSDAMRRRLTRSNYIFSGMKAFHELREAFPSLLDENGDRKPFERFLNDVQSIDSKYNSNYLRAEYNFVAASAEMAGRWERFMADGDRYYLQYRTCKDGNVRPEHAALDGVTLPPSDSFWSELYPPNGWNCRCTVVQVRKSKCPETSHDEAMRLGDDALQRDTKGIFRFNPGLEQKSVPDYNPYTIRRCRDCDIARGKLKLARQFVPDNELCAACAIVHQCYGDKEKSESAIRRKHYLREMESLLMSRVAKTAIDGTKMKVQFTKEGNKHLYSDTLGRTKRVRMEDLKDLDRWLEHSKPVGDASPAEGHNNGYDHFYYFKVQIRDRWVRLNVGMRLRIKGDGQIYRDYTLYSVNDI